MQDLPIRTELHPVPSLTMTDRQFLLGEAGGVPTMLAGWLSLPQSPGRRPAVLLMHGSGGIGAAIPHWVRLINAAGMAAFVLDGFSGRGLTSVSADQALLGRLAFVHDIYRALGVLAAHPGIDADRIAVMGFSRGGQGAFYAAMARFHRLWNPGGVIPAATLAIYPDCGTRYIEDTVMVPRPIRVFHGTPDDFNPVAPVRAHLERLRAAGCDVALAEYAGAHHGFDNPLSRVAARTSGQSVRDCRIEEQAPGLLVNAATGEPFGYADPCVARDAHVGGNPAAAGMLRVDVMACLAALIGR